MARIITVTSGKGGVGKTGICVNLAISLATTGYRTCVFDADLGLANINILLNLYPRHTLADVIEKKKTIDEIVIRNVHGIDIIPGSSGVEKMADLSRDQIHSLIQSFSRIDAYDFIIFDTSGGASKSVISFSMACKELILVIIPEPTSLTDAYAVLKILSANGYRGVPKVIVNQAKNRDGAQKVYYRFAQTVQKYLSVKIEYLGMVLKDPHVTEAVTQQQPLLGLFPECGFSRSIRQIADNITRQASGAADQGELDTFFTRYVRFLTQPLKRFREDKEASLTRPIEKQVEMDQSPEPESGEAPKDIPEAVDPSQLDIKSMLAKLVDTMTTVSGELKALRIVAQNQMETGDGKKRAFFREGGPDATEHGVALPPDMPSDLLDFETYRNERERRE